MTVHSGSRWLGRRYLFRLGRLQVSSYGAMLYLGVVAGTIAGGLVAGAQGLPEPRFVTAVILLLIPALVGSRLWYVIQHLDRYRAQPHRLWRRAEGGGALFGGLVLSIGLSPLVLAWVSLPFGSFWDAATITMLVGLIFTRLGCLINGCCSGRPTAGPLGVWLPDHAGHWERRYPTQLLEAAAGAAMLAAALAFRAALPVPGALFVLAVIAYVLIRLLLEPLRATLKPGRTLWLHLALAAALLAGVAVVYWLGGVG